jgi:hypothetical protein
VDLADQAVVRVVLEDRVAPVAAKEDLEVKVDVRVDLEVLVVRAEE